MSQRRGRRIDFFITLEEYRDFIDDLCARYSLIVVSDHRTHIEQVEGPWFPALLEDYNMWLSTDDRGWQLYRPGKWDRGLADYGLINFQPPVIRNEIVLCKAVAWTGTAGTCELGERVMKTFERIKREMRKALLNPTIGYNRELGFASAQAHRDLWRGRADDRTARGPSAPSQRW